MEDEQKVLQEIIFRFPNVWKDFFGLYTQYIGYLNADIAITLLTLKRIADSTLDFNCLELDLKRTNDYASHYNLEKLPYRKEIEAVLPELWKFLDKYDLSAECISETTWNEFIDYWSKEKQRRNDYAGIYRSRL